MPHTAPRWNTQHWDAIIVAGGRASRLGGIDKPALVYDGRSLIRRAIDAARPARHVAVVGYSGLVPTSRPVSRASESPRFGGPAAAIAAGLSSLRHSESEFTAVFAGDLPHVGPAVALLLSGLGAAPPGFDGIIAVDGAGRRQHLLALYRTAALREVVAGQPSLDGLSVRALLGPLRLWEFALPGELCADIDTPDDALALGIALPRVPAASG